MQNKRINEPLKSLQVFNIILLGFAAVYALFYSQGFVWSLYQNSSDIVVCTIFFVLNLFNALAIGFFLSGVYSKKIQRIVVYLWINSITIGIEMIVVIIVFGFKDDLWQSKWKTIVASVFSLIFEIVFMGSNCLVCVLVRTHLKVTTFAKLQQTSKTRQKSDKQLIQDKFEFIVTQLDKEVDQFLANWTERVDTQLAALNRKRTNTESVFNLTSPINSQIANRTSSLR